MDPHAENYYHASPFAYVENNPISRIDPDGRDWYEDKDGNLMWRRSQDGTYTDDDGNEWTNVGTSAIFYHGNTATYFGQNEDEDGNISLFSEKINLNSSENELSENQELMLGQLNSDWSRRKAEEYWNEPTAKNAFSFALSEALSQWTNPELVVTGLAVGVSGLQALSKAPKTSVGPLRGYTRHGLNQAISRDGGRGVSTAAIRDAVVNPRKIVQQSGGRVKYVGKDATVILNSEGRVISTYGKPRSQ